MNRIKNIKIKSILDRLYVLSIYYSYNKVDIYLIIFLRFLPFVLAFLLINFYLVDMLLCDGDYVGDHEFNNPEPVELPDTSFTYQPYRPGIHSTTEGYRYELNGLPKPQELDGTAINRNVNNIPRIENPSHCYNPEVRDVPLESNTYNGVYPNDNPTEPKDSEYYRDNYLCNPRQGNTFNRDDYRGAEVSVFKKAKASMKKAVDFVSKDLDKTRAKIDSDTQKSRAATVRASEALAEGRRIQSRRRLDRMNELVKRR